MHGTCVEFSRPQFLVSMMFTPICFSLDGSDFRHRKSGVLKYTWYLWMVKMFYKVRFFHASDL